MTTTIAKFLIVITALSAPSHLYAQSQSARDSEPEGRSMLIGGIVTTSVLAGAGVLSVMVWMFGDARYMPVGLGLAAAGAGIGVPMIVTGAKKYRAWKKSQASVQGDGSMSLAFSDLNSTAQDQYMQIKELRTKTPQVQLRSKSFALPLIAYEF